ncbi:UPF0052-domain-containing protein [Hesseltinella vesiculosa]|uniref:UPF0052-domain-containing protein n=1 Tax=Hesseltinella vesiculosa TaxID=101127 RepID=A0A1X2G8W3_9FUNG|nr:UPF0052-domain-containing protein [Hesseltinella vesiculosa]
MTIPPSFVVFSGGSACNHITKSFQSVSPNISYIIGISDNGGSSSELQRLLGGPAIGDFRSRLTRLIDTVDPCPSDERMAIRDLLSHRLSGDPSIVKDEWAAIAEGRHSLWKKIPADKKETIRGFLTHFNGEILKRAHKRFNFCNGSVGNFFLTGARCFFGSLEAALFLFSAITGVNEPTSVIPVINTNHTATIAAVLEDGQTIIGQCEISHPSPYHTPADICNPIDAFMRLGLDDDNIRSLKDDGDDSNAMPRDQYGHSSLNHAKEQCNRNLFFSKHTNEHLPASIQRVFYINEYGQEIYPVPNAKVITQLSTKRTLVYSMGSLFTSLVPNLILRNIGKAIAESHSLKFKVLLLNGSHDRETHGFTAMDFITTITGALNESQRIDCRRAFYETAAHLKHHYLRMTPNMGDHIEPASRSASQHHSFHGSLDSGYASSNSPMAHFPPFPDQLFHASSPSVYITHLVYLDKSEIVVDVEAIESIGIKCIQVKSQ